MPAASRAAATAASAPSLRPSQRRAPGSSTSAASAPDQTWTAPSASPTSRATASEHTTRAAAWSTNGNAFIRFVYGSAMIRLPPAVEASSSGVARSRNQA